MGQKLSADLNVPLLGYERLNNQEDDSYQQIHPQELKFPFELNKKIPCSMKLSNTTDNYLAFKVKPTARKKYRVKPKIGVLLPRSTFDVTVTMKAQTEAPPDMQCKDKFLVKIIVLSKNGATIKDITPTMFHKESGYEVKEYKWKVVYVAPPQSPSLVREGSDKDSKASNEQVEQQDTSTSFQPDVRPDLIQL